MAGAVCSATTKVGDTVIHPNDFVFADIDGVAIVKEAYSKYGSL